MRFTSNLIALLMQNFEDEYVEFEEVPNSEIKVLFPDKIEILDAEVEEIPYQEDLDHPGPTFAFEEGFNRFDNIEDIASRSRFSGKRSVFDKRKL